MCEPQDCTVTPVSLDSTTWTPPILMDVIRATVIQPSPPASSVTQSTASVCASPVSEDDSVTGALRAGTAVEPGAHSVPVMRSGVWYTRGQKSGIWVVVFQMCL